MADPAGEQMASVAEGYLAGREAVRGLHTWLRETVAPVLAAIGEAGLDPAPVLAELAGVLRGIADQLDPVSAAADELDPKDAP